MQLSLRAGTKLYINGAVLRVDRKVQIELLNDVVFLLENHIMQFDEATTPVKQIYFVIQSVLIDPKSKNELQPIILTMLRGLAASSEGEAEAAELRSALAEVAADKHFQALKRIRKMFAQDEVDSSSGDSVLTTFKRRQA